MKLSDHYQGDNDPFEGDRMLYLRSLPAGARVAKAAIRLTPKKGPTTGAVLFQEVFTFNTTVGPGELPADSWGVTKSPPGTSIEVDFHARRTLAAVAGSGGATTLQVDLGGAYVGIADDGTFMSPDKTDWPATLSSSAAALPGLTASKFRLSRVAANTNSLDV